MMKAALPADLLLVPLNYYDYQAYDGRSRRSNQASLLVQ
jgi:hypothetical protein